MRMKHFVILPLLFFAYLVHGIKLCIKDECRSQVSKHFLNHKESPLSWRFAVHIKMRRTCLARIATYNIVHIIRSRISWGFWWWDWLNRKWIDIWVTLFQKLKKIRFYKIRAFKNVQNLWVWYSSFKKYVHHAKMI